MKKIFTLAAAVLASFSLWAALPLESLPQGTTSFSSAADWGSSVSKNKAIFDDANHFMALSQGNDLKFDEANGMKIGNSSKPSAVVFLLGAENDLTINVGQNGSDMTVTLYYMGESIEALSADNVNAEGTSKGSVALTKEGETAKGVISASACPAGYYKIHGNLRFCLKSVKAGEDVVSTDPVSSVTISGKAEGYVGSSVELTAATDAKADSYYWTVDGSVQENSDSKKFTLALEAVRTYAVVCYARNQYNEAEQFVASEAFNVVASEKPAGLEQVDVNEATVWDWTKAGTGSIEWKDSTTPRKDKDTVLLANVEGINNNADFNSQALLFAGQYPLRDGKYCQGPTLIFKTTVPGYIQVTFSNTGTKDDPRYIAVNDVVNTEVGSKNTTAVESAYIPVEAGEVRINGAFADGTVQYLRIYKVVFGTGEIPTAIENTEAIVKAVKVVRNGQLLIEKNGVLYNAQGAVVK